LSSRKSRGDVELGELFGAERELDKNYERKKYTNKCGTKAEVYDALNEEINEYLTNQAELTEEKSKVEHNSQFSQRAP
jgi:hypothetical protein